MNVCCAMHGVGQRRALHTLRAKRVQEKKNSLNAGFISHVIQECDGLVPHPGQVARDDSLRVARSVRRDPPERTRDVYHKKRAGLRDKGERSEERMLVMKTLVVVRLITPVARLSQAHATGQCYCRRRCRCRSCNAKRERGPQCRYRGAGGQSFVHRTTARWVDKLIRSNAIE